MSFLSPYKPFGTGMKSCYPYLMFGILSFLLRNIIPDVRCQMVNVIEIKFGCVGLGT